MTQIIRCSTDTYFNAQRWFACNVIPELPNDDRVWTKSYKKWLLEQGAVIKKFRPHNMSGNAIGVAMYNDCLEFDRDQDLTMFVLRWA